MLYMTRRKPTDYSTNDPSYSGFESKPPVVVAPQQIKTYKVIPPSNLWELPSERGPNTLNM